ncbi:sigma 54-interacting transcriptional regulator [Desulfobacula sp.]|uniref:sigma-54 interaction domain-containing protein n=1 Tax=Desulfobacula sp. TaxID=2593537 RepID=UPI0026100D25|nr:sigma 54-interacting transcriptional regulator [Desulfobacula sp.]
MDNDEKIQLFDALVNNPYIGICIIDKNGTAVFRAKINEELTGIKNSEIIGKHYSIMPHHKELMEVLTKGIPKFNWPFKTIKGSHAIVHRIPLKIGNETIGALSIISMKDVKEIQTLLDKYDLLKNRLQYYDKELRHLRTAKYTFENIIGVSDKVVTNRKLAKNYSKGNSPVLITGETGTGKELYAHAIHLTSNRKDGPFIRINCAAIPADLLESELFGYEEGAFTGAKKGVRIGKFELATHGTIFLDEISSLNISMQPKLLTVLQNHEIERIGGSRVIKLDFRVISATNKDLEQMIKEGSFRSDLYYRLSVLNLSLGELRNKKEDIAPLAQHFLESFNEEYGFNINEIDPAVMNIFSNWDWPGNIRELGNVMERAVQMSNKKCILVDDLPDYLVAFWKLKPLQSSTENQINVLKTSRDGIERKLIESALISNNWNKSRAAKNLGVSRANLYSLIKKHSLQK